MDRQKLKYPLLLITFGIVLYLGLSNIGQVTKWISFVFGLATPLVIGIAAAFVLNLLLNLFEKKLLGKVFDKYPKIGKRRRGICLILTYLSSLMIITALIFFIIPQVIESASTFVNKFVSNFPQYGKSIQGFLTELTNEWGLSEDLWDKIPSNWKEIVQTVTNFAGDAISTLFNLTIGVTTSVINFFIGVIFSAYILASKEKLIRIFKKLNYAYVRPPYAEKLASLASETTTTFNRFVGGQLTEALILGSLCCIGMLILRIPYAPMISVLIGLTSLIPILGAYLGAIPSALILLMESPIKALIFIIFLIVLQQVEGNLIYPKVVGNAIGLEGFWVFLAITLGGSVFGVMGMLIGVPVVAVLYTVISKFTNERLKKKNIRVETPAPAGEKKAEPAEEE